MVNAVYYQFSPPVVDQGEEQDVILQVGVTGSPTAVTLQLASTGAEVPLKDAGSATDRVAGDSLWMASLKAGDVLYQLTPDNVNRNFVGYLKLYDGNNEVGKYNIIADILTPGVPPAAIRVLSRSVQYTDHIVNIWSSNFFSTFSVQSVIREFYQYFRDHFDHLNLIYAVPFFENRHHLSVRNDVLGIGIQTFDQTAAYGSGGRLLGCTVFPLPTYFDGASAGYQHEFGHQWINFLPFPPLSQAAPHWPLSDLASDIMGWGVGKNTEGLEFDFDLEPHGENFRLVPNNDPKVFSDLSLYLMGLLPANQVGKHFVFDKQDQSMASGELEGPVTWVSIDDIITQLGPRVPDAGQSQKELRVATLMVSRDGLLPPSVMCLYDWFAARAEATHAVSYSEGLIKGQTNPFYLSTQKLGRLNAGIEGGDVMSLAHSMWTHGHCVQIEFPDQLSSVRRMGMFAQVVGNGGVRTWFHFAIPTPVIVNGSRLKADAVLIRFRCGPNAAVHAVCVFDGESLIAQHDNLNLHPSDWLVQRFQVPGSPEIRWGVGISINVGFGLESGREIDFASAGCDFLP